MSDLEKTEQELTEILANVAKVQNIGQYELFVNTNSVVTEGFLSDFYTGAIKNIQNGIITSVAIKKVPKKGGIFTDYKVVFKNENHVYSKIFPELNVFQDEKNVTRRFDNVPKYFCGSLEPQKEYIAMQNIKNLGYRLLDKKNYLDENHLNLVFESFGKFHALSFAFKDQHLNKYNEIVKDLINVLEGLKENDVVLESIENNVLSGFKVFDKPEDIDITVKLKKIGDIKNFLLNGVKLKGQYQCIVHGDSWSNNMLFKYKDSGELDDIKLLDFQLTKEGSPSHDLVFFFYSAASKQDLNRLDKYLGKYYESFSNFSKQLGSDPEKLYPWDVLKYEWKQFAAIGALFSIDLWVPKLMDNNDILNLRTKGGNKEEMLKMWEAEMEKVRTSDVFKETTRNLILHLVEHDFL